MTPIIRRGRKPVEKQYVGVVLLWFDQDGAVSDAVGKASKPAVAW